MKDDLIVNGKLHEEFCWMSLAGVYGKLFQDLIL